VLWFNSKTTGGDKSVENNYHQFN